MVIACEVIDKCLKGNLLNTKHLVLQFITQTQPWAQSALMLETVLFQCLTFFTYRNFIVST